ncbi:MAG: thermonuclease family protein [Candidatus Thorarchaeota archaeon]
MADVKIYWDPLGVSVDTIGDTRFIRIKDGDTPVSEMSIRMLSIDTPEKAYKGKASGHNERLKNLAGWLEDDTLKDIVPEDLAKHLIPRLETGKAGELQEKQGEKATKEFQKLLDKRLELENDDEPKHKRKLFIRAADRHFEQYGRLLAYISPNLTRAEVSKLKRDDPKRATFNLNMVEGGWAATLPIYPSCPRYDDLVILQKAAKSAFDGKKGFWEDDKTLTGYEFRMCVRLAKIAEKLANNEEVYWREKESWIYRYCVDMTTREIFPPKEYYKVKPYNRLFVWAEDLIEAVSRLNLIPPSGNSEVPET